MLGLIISFEEEVYTVNEADGEVTVSVAVLSGVLSSDVVVRMDTKDGNAKGEEISINSIHPWLLSLSVCISAVMFCAPISHTTDGDDYRSVSELFVFNAVHTHFKVSLPITDDIINEGVESIYLHLELLTSGANIVFLTPDEATVEIVDDDGMTIITHSGVYESTNQLFPRILNQETHLNFLILSYNLFASISCMWPTVTLVI